MEEGEASPREYHSAVKGELFYPPQSLLTLLLQTEKTSTRDTYLTQSQATSGVTS